LHYSQVSSIKFEDFWNIFEQISSAILEKHYKNICGCQRLW